MERRNILKLGVAATAGVALGSCSDAKEKIEAPKPIQQANQNIRHSACRWCYNNIPLEELAEKAKDIGLASIELLDPDEWDVVINKGLSCAISNGSALGITKGFNDANNHEALLADYTRIIPMAADKGIKQIICFSGNRNGITRSEGLERCAVGLDPVITLAKEHNVKIVMELLNSKIDHKDYQCDRTDWGVALVEKLGSEHFSLLYDIYHMQIMEGDVIRTIQDNMKYISHFHTGGVPGRNEIDESQELNYKAIIEAIGKSDFDGYVSQEFIPKNEDPFASLRKAIEICNV